VAFGELATVIGKGGLDGTIPVTFGGTAALTDGASLAGTIAVTFDDNATLTAKGTLQGTLNVTFSETAALTAQSTVIGGLYNISATFPTSSTVTVTLFDPLDNSTVATDSASALEAGTSGVYVWDIGQITTPPAGYKEYVYGITDSSTKTGGLLKLVNGIPLEVVQLETWQRLGLDSNNPLTTNDDNSITFAGVTLAAVNADTSTTQTREDV